MPGRYGRSQPPGTRSPRNIRTSQHRHQVEVRVVTGMTIVGMKPPKLVNGTRNHWPAVRGVHRRGPRARVGRARTAGQPARASIRTGRPGRGRRNGTWPPPPQGDRYRHRQQDRKPNEPERRRGGAADQGHHRAALRSEFPNLPSSNGFNHSQYWTGIGRPSPSCRSRRTS